MKDILLQCGPDYIECTVDGLKLTYTYSDNPKWHYVLTLRDGSSYRKLKRKLQEIRDEYDYEEACTLLNSHERDEFFTDDMCQVHCDPRDKEEILEYLREANDKVWLMRNCCIADRVPVHEAGRAGVNRILNTYDDIPRNGYSDWECGYWNGIMGALRWVLGDEKDFLDT